MILEINIPQIIEFGVTLEEYFLLYCVNYSQKDILIQYTKIRKFSDKDFNSLEERKLLNFTRDPEGLIYFSSLTLSEKSLSLFPKVDLTFEQAFAELRSVYPKKFAERALHTDLERCRNLHKKAISKKDGSLDVNQHKMILKCTEVYVNGLRKAGKMQYLQGLPAYLNQQNWKAYEEEVGKAITKSMGHGEDI